MEPLVFNTAPWVILLQKVTPFFSWNLVGIRQRSHLFPIQSNLKIKGEKNRTKNALAWAKRRDLQHRR